MPTALDLPEVDGDRLFAEPVELADEIRPRSWVAHSNVGFIVMTHAGCEATLQNPGLWPGIHRLLADMGLEPEAISGPGGNLLSSEGPDHVRLRRVVSQWFTPRHVDELSGRVRELVGSLVAPLTAAGEGDFMSEVAFRMPGPVFCWLMGAPPEAGDRVFELSAVLLQAFLGDPELADEVSEAAVGMGAFVDELIAAKRDDPGDDLMSIMIAAADASEITIDDVHSLSFEMLSASTDNTAHSAGLAISTLARHPDQWRRLVDDPSLAARAVEECARVEPRVGALPVFAPAATTVLDLDVPADAMVWMNVRGAHFDPDVYPDPHRIDVTREHARPQLNFGTGRHYCLGAALARMELTAMMDVLAHTWHDLRVAGVADVVHGYGGAEVPRLEIEVA